MPEEQHEALHRTDAWWRLWDAEIHEILTGLHTALLCRIEEYDPVAMRATLQPLVQELAHRERDDPEWVTPSLIYKAAVACMRAGPYVIRPPYQVGDMVIAVVSERSTDLALETDDIAEQVGMRQHSRTDAVVVGGMTPEPRQLPTEHGQDLLIARHDNGTLQTRVVLSGYDVTVVTTDGGDIALESDGDISLTADGDISITAEGAVSIAAGGAVSVAAGGNVSVATDLAYTVTCQSGSIAADDGFTITRQSGAESVVWE